MRTRLALALFLAASVAPLTLAQGAMGLVRYDGHKVVRITLTDEKQVETMRAIGADLWTHREGPGQMEYRVSPAQLAALQASGLPFEVTIPNVQTLIDNERASLLAPRGAGDYFDDYRRYEDMEQFVDDLAADHPALVERMTVGQSLEGREIFAIKIGPDGGGPNKAAVVFNAMQHAREWISGTTSLYLANELIDGYGVDPRITAALDAVDVYIVPVSNPDGYVWTWDVERLWRKNRRNNGNGTTGVDLNRNYSIGWGLNGGSSPSGSSETYRGVAPFSEPESTALAAFIEGIPGARAHVDLHSYSELVLSPWGWTEDPTDDAMAFDSLNSALQDAIDGVHGHEYLAGPAGSTLYIASGTAPDWSYGELGVFGWTIELRPVSSSQGGFILPPSQIIPTGEEIMPALLLLMEYSANEVYFHDASGAGYIDSSAGAGVSIGATPTRGASINQSESALRYRVGSTGAFSSSPLSFGAMNIASGTLPAGPCGQEVEYFFEIATAGGTEHFPADGEPLLTATTYEAQVAFEDSFATDTGWTIGAPGDAATTGVWFRGVPNATNYQPGSGDPAGSAGECFYTGYSNPGDADGSQDVDGGSTTLTSPPFDATADDGEVFLYYSRWFATNGTPGNDNILVQISNNDGASWVEIERAYDDTRVWTRRSVRVADFVPPTNAMRVRFVASDANSPSLAEAAIDDVRFVALGCSSVLGDTNGDGEVNFADLNSVLSSFGASGAPGFNPADIDSDGDVDFADLNTVLSNFGVSN